MIVKCEQCQTRFRIADEKVSERGIKVRCTKCQNTFVVRRTDAAAAPEIPVPRPVPVRMPAVPAVAPGGGVGAGEPSGSPQGFFDSAGPDPFGATDPFAPEASPGSVSKDPFQPTGAAGPFAPEASPGSVSEDPFQPAGADPFGADPFFAPALTNKTPAPEDPVMDDGFFEADATGKGGPDEVVSAGFGDSEPEAIAFGSDRDALSMDVPLDFSAGEGAPAPVAVKVPHGPTEAFQKPLSTEVIPAAAVPGGLQGAVEAPMPGESSVPVAAPPTPSREKARPLSKKARFSLPVWLPRMLGAAMSFALALGMIAMVAVLATMLLERKPLQEAMRFEHLRALFTPPSSLVVREVSNGVYETEQNRTVFYVRGEVQNHGDQARLARVKAEILHEGHLVQVQEGLAGQVPTPEALFKLRSLEDVQVLTRTLDAQAQPVATSGRTPFLLTFFDHPPDMTGYRVRVSVEEVSSSTAQR